ncbi:SRPBCC family protein [Leptospira sp. WS60.C2]
MKIIILSLVSLFILLFIGIVLFLPNKRTVRKEYHFAKELTLVWKKIRDIEGQKNWRSDIKSIEILSKNPETWKEFNQNGIPTTFQTLTLEKHNEWSIKVIDPDYINAKWTGKLIPSEFGTTVIFEESISVVSPFYRVLSYLFFDVENVMQTYLKDLTLSLGETWDERKVKTSME